MHSNDIGRTPGTGRRKAPEPRTARPSAAPEAMGPQTLDVLQRTMGNAAVSRLLSEAGQVSADGSEGDAPAVQRSTVADVLRSPGRPLDPRLRDEMEQRLGSDFSDVRLHTGAAAQRSAEEISARAYTAGSHVVIGTDGGDKHTLAHELTHVIQQRQGPVTGTDDGNGLRISDPSDRYEREAEAAAHRAMATPTPPARAASPSDERES
ncbi:MULTISPECIES: eCIS core domain-containing protein [unclassified Streptomyces]|uniref:eCIS core domain-containing protein n=1 Tax=unclassified Streptomyces TaxID=2593676 RepID=UPI00386EABDD